MYASPPPIPRSPFRRIIGTFLWRNATGGIKSGVTAGTSYGCLMGTLMFPGIGTIYGLGIGLVVGLGAGLIIGIASAIMLSIISATWFNPIRAPEMYRRVMGSASVIIIFAGAFLLGWLIGIVDFSSGEIWMMLIFVVGPAIIGAFFNWKASQQLAEWYESERSYEQIGSQELGIRN